MAVYLRPWKVVAGIVMKKMNSYEKLTSINTVEMKQLNRG